MANLGYVETYLEMAGDALGKLMLAGEVRETANLRQVVFRLHDATQELKETREDIRRTLAEPKPEWPEEILGAKPHPQPTKEK